VAESVVKKVPLSQTMADKGNNDRVRVGGCFARIDASRPFVALFPSRGSVATSSTESFFVPIVLLCKHCHWL
jgi:hypothetical protein